MALIYLVSIKDLIMDTHIIIYNSCQKNHNWLCGRGKHSKFLGFRCGVDENFVLLESDAASLGNWWRHIPEKVPYTNTSLFFFAIGRKNR